MMKMSLLTLLTILYVIKFFFFFSIFDIAAPMTKGRISFLDQSQYFKINNVTKRPNSTLAFLSSVIMSLILGLSQVTPICHLLHVFDTGPISSYALFNYELSPIIIMLLSLSAQLFSRNPGLDMPKYKNIGIHVSILEI